MIEVFKVIELEGSANISLDQLFEVDNISRIRHSLKIEKY